MALLTAKEAREIITKSTLDDRMADFLKAIEDVSKSWPLSKRDEPAHIDLSVQHADFLDRLEELGYTVSPLYSQSEDATEPNANLIAYRISW